MRRVSLSVGLLGMAVTCWAQLGRQAPPSTGGNATAPTTTTTPTPGPTTTPTPYPVPSTRQPPSTEQRQATSIPEIQRPIFLSGKVVLEDGTPPPEAVTIERECRGVVRPEGYTDSKGRFSFQLGQNLMVFYDASVSNAGNLGIPRGTSGNAAASLDPFSVSNEHNLDACEIRASLPGYRSDAIGLMGRRYLDDPNLGTIVLHRNAKVEGTTISVTSLAAPKDAKKAFDKGRDAARKDKWEEARKELEKAVALHPKYAAAWCALGDVRTLLKDFVGAEKAYREAFAADPKYVVPYVQLALVEVSQQEWQDAVDTSSLAIKLDPANFPAAYVYNSLAQLNLRHMDAAEASAREALKLDTTHAFPLTNRIMAAVSAVKGDLTSAAQYLRSYLEFAPAARDAPLVRSQLQQLEKPGEPAR